MKMSFNKTPPLPYGSKSDVMMGGWLPIAFRLRRPGCNFILKHFQMFSNIFNDGELGADCFKIARTRVQIFSEDPLKAGSAQKVLIKSQAHVSTLLDVSSSYKVSKVENKQLM